MTFNATLTQTSLSTFTERLAKRFFGEYSDWHANSGLQTQHYAEFADYILKGYWPSTSPL